MRVLGIETSCDENSVAVVEDGHKLLSNVIYTQVDLHRTYGGVVPEVAARSHVEVMVPTIEAALEQAFPYIRVHGSAEKQASEARWAEIDAIAVAHGPGLGGSLLIGTLAARTLALIKDKPLYGVHHGQGHIYANFINWTLANGKWKTGIDKWREPVFPVLALVVSGGHTHLVLMDGHDDFRLLGQTQDDAAGEAFDKAAKMLGLPYPGGPSIERAAHRGNADFIKFPRAKMSGFDFSFSGLKTAVLRAVQELVGVGIDYPSFKLAKKLKASQIQDVAASFQRAAVQALVDTTMGAWREFQPRTLVIAGGVAANQELRRQLAKAVPTDINYAPIWLCTDNAAMIASLGYYAAQYRPADDPLKLEIDPSLRLAQS